MYGISAFSRAFPADLAGDHGDRNSTANAAYFWPLGEISLLTVEICDLASSIRNILPATHVRRTESSEPLSVIDLKVVCTVHTLASE